MAKSSGLGDAFWLGGYDISGDVGSLGRIGGGLAGTQDVTGINVGGMERVGLARDGGLEWVSFFNPATARAHEVLSTLPTTDRTMTYCRGTAQGSPAACLVGKQIGYDPSRAADGSLTIAVTAEANGYGLEWGRLVTAGIVTHTEADEETSLDLGAASSFGLQAYLHVMDFDGDDVTITLQGSSDDGDSDAFADITGGSFTQVTAGPTSERIQTARDQAVERYIRVVTTTDAGFTSLSFAVVVVVNPLEVLF